MNNKIVVPCSPAHLPGLLPFLREAEKKETEAVGNPTERLEMYCNAGPAITLVVNGEPIAMGGFIFMWPGVANTWSLTGTKVDDFPTWAHKQTLIHLEDTITEFSLHRVESAVRCDNQRAYDWHIRLGYKDESIMTQYGADKIDYWKMVKLCHS